MRPLMEGTGTQHRDAVFLSECTWQAKRGVRTPDWKFIRCVDPGVYPRDGMEVYDLRVDPAEQVNVAAERPDIVGQMDAMLADWLRERLAGRPDPMDEVVAAGLPAVRRLNDLIAELTCRDPTPCVAGHVAGISLGAPRDQERMRNATDEVVECDGHADHPFRHRHAPG